MSEINTATMDGEGMQVVTFRLDKEYCAFEIAKVREVLIYEGVTSVPRSPKYMGGVINLRGSVVPIVDLKAKFDMLETVEVEDDRDTYIVIVEIEIDDEPVTLGCLADSVQQVAHLADHEIQPPPRIGTFLPMEFILGMGKIGEEFVTILDVDRIFSREEFALALGLDSPTPGGVTKGGGDGASRSACV